jgi:hypothetical protein
MAHVEPRRGASDLSIGVGRRQSSRARHCRLTRSGFALLCVLFSVGSGGGSASQKTDFGPYVRAGDYCRGGVARPIALSLDKGALCLDGIITSTSMSPQRWIWRAAVLLPRDRTCEYAEGSRCGRRRSGCLPVRLREFPGACFVGDLCPGGRSRRSGNDVSLSRSSLLWIPRWSRRDGAVSYHSALRSGPLWRETG